MFFAANNIWIVIVDTKSGALNADGWAYLFGEIRLN